MKALTRRSFLKSSLAGAAACTLSPRSWSQVVGANDVVRVAIVGLNGRGESHINEFGKMQTLSDKYLALRKSLTYIAPDSLDKDPLDQQILSCARGLSSMAASGQFEDVPACH